MVTALIMSIAISFNVAWQNPGALWDNAQKMHITCYYSSPKAHTYSGEQVRIGGCASNKANLGKYAYVFNEDKALIGIYKCNDIGGHYSLKNGTAIDIWQPSLEECWNYIHENGDYAYVVIK